MVDYKIVMHKETVFQIENYMEHIKTQKKVATYLQKELQDFSIVDLSVDRFIELLFRTKKTMIFAESAVRGDGFDWNLRELSILGDISISVPVTVFDNGRHQRPHVYRHPFKATLLYTPGALLRSGRGHEYAADWVEVVENGQLQGKAYQQLYERRLLPLFRYAHEEAQKKDKQAFITIPGLGCGQFAGPFIGTLGEELKKALYGILDKHAAKLTIIRAVYDDPFQEWKNERHEFGDLSFMVRPLLQGNEQKSQLCKHSFYEEDGDDFSNCELFSCVVSDHLEKE